MLTLATTIGESAVACAPSIVVPHARLSTLRPSRTIVIVAAWFARAKSSNARLAFGIAASSGDSVGVVVDVVVDDDEVVVVVLGVEIVVVVGAGSGSGVGSGVVEAGAVVVE